MFKRSADCCRDLQEREESDFAPTISLEHKIGVRGPNDADLLFYPDAASWMWSLRNSGLRRIDEFRIELATVQSFDVEKLRTESHGTSVSDERRDPVDPSVTVPASEERHYPISYWARPWGFSPKTVREWFHDEYGPGILRQRNTGRRSKRDYTTITVSPSAAGRVYAKRVGQELIH